MVEMTIGSRFYYKDKLCEAVKEGNGIGCEKCVFDKYASKCAKAKCLIEERHDGKSVYFKEVKGNDKN